MTDDKQPYEPGKHIIRSLTFFTCKKHGTQYPQGGTCPACDAEKARKR